MSAWLLRPFERADACQNVLAAWFVFSLCLLLARILQHICHRKPGSHVIHLISVVFWSSWSETPATLLRSSAGIENSSFSGGFYGSPQHWCLTLPSANECVQWHNQISPGQRQAGRELRWFGPFLTFSFSKYCISRSYLNSNFQVKVVFFVVVFLFLFFNLEAWLRFRWISAFKLPAITAWCSTTSDNYAIREPCSL